MLGIEEDDLEAMLVSSYKKGMKDFRDSLVSSLETLDIRGLTSEDFADILMKVEISGKERMDS